MSNTKELSNIQSQIIVNQEKIDKKIKLIKTHLKELMDMIKNQNEYFVIFRRDNNNKYFSRTLGGILGLSVANTNATVSNFRYISEHEVMDKKFFEKLSLLKNTTRKDICSNKTPKKSPLIKAGLMIGDIRNASKGLSWKDKQILTSMINDLQDQLR